jgi:hypothetical protein
MTKVVGGHFHPAHCLAVFGHSGLRGNEIADKLAGDGTVNNIVGPEPALRVYRRNIWKKIKRWIDNQHMVMWRILLSTQRQPRKIISDPSPAAKTRLPSFNRTQSRVVTGLLTGLNTLRKYLHFMGMSCSLLCRRCGVEEVINRRLVRMWSFGFTQTCILGFLLSGPVTSQSIIAIWSFSKGTGLTRLDIRLKGAKGPSKGRKGSNPFKVRYIFLGSWLRASYFNMYKYIQRDATVLSWLLFQELYMFRAFTMPIIRNKLLHRQPLV